jgi:hypothetical protein
MGSSRTTAALEPRGRINAIREAVHWQVPFLADWRCGVVPATCIRDSTIAGDPWDRSTLRSTLRP